jgi:hypothetical protein
MIGIIDSTELNFFILLYDKKNKMIKFNKNSILKNKKTQKIAKEKTK